MGGRTLKTGQSRWFVGYKKHSFRLWWREYSHSVLLVPLVSWAAPANVSEGGLLVLSGRPCQPEEKVEIRFALPTTGRIVTVRAIARWVRTSRGTGAIGLEFEPLSQEVRGAIRRYVQAMGGA